MNTSMISDNFAALDIATRASNAEKATGASLLYKPVDLWQKLRDLRFALQAEPQHSGTPLLTVSCAVPDLGGPAAEFAALVKLAAAKGIVVNG